MKGRELWLAGAILMGIAVAFLAGMMFAGRDAVGQDDPIAAAVEREPRRAAEVRKFYSPNISSDPYVLDQQRRVVEALERQCRHHRQHCREAQQARRWMNKRDTD